jgi:V/A-type H+-transporting ATPase subunit F
MANNSYKIAIIGTKDQILGFKALGLKAVPVQNAEEAKDALYKLNDETSGKEENAKKTYAIIFVLEDLAMKIPEDDYKKLTKDALPAIIPIPGIKGTTGYGLQRIKKMVEQAVGSDIFG